jgi:hypothetical protein
VLVRPVETEDFFDFEYFGSHTWRCRRANCRRYVTWWTEQDAWRKLEDHRRRHHGVIALV